jgi:hydroxyacylglutathione hydrolase
MTSLLIEQFTCRQDNFGVILHDPLTGETASIDAPDASRITDRLGDGGWKLSHLLITHHHPDHVEGIPPLSTPIRPKSSALKPRRRRSPG